MPFIDWTGTPSDSEFLYFPDVDGWTKVIKSTPVAISTGTPVGVDDDPSLSRDSSHGSWSGITNATANDGTNSADCDLTRPGPFDGTTFTFGGSPCLILQNWGFDIPDGATIQAIHFQMEYASDDEIDPDGPFQAALGLYDVGLSKDGDSWYFSGKLPYANEFGNRQDQVPLNLGFYRGTDSNPLGTSFCCYPSITDFNFGGILGVISMPGGDLGAFGYLEDLPPGMLEITRDDPTFTNSDINASAFGCAVSLACSETNSLRTGTTAHIYSVAMAVYYTTGGGGSSVSGFAASDFIPSLAGFAGSISGGFGCSPGGSGAPVYDMQIPGQPTGENFVLDDNCSDWFVRARRTDEYGSSEWGFLYIPSEDIIKSGFLRGQGSVISVLDNQFEPLFTYTSAAGGGGGPNTGEVNITWPSFMLEYADTSLQTITGGAVDSGLTLESSSSEPTTYNVFPKIQPWNGSVVEMDNPSGIPGGFCIPDGSPYLSVAGFDTQKDGFVNLAGPPLAFQVIVPSASGGGSGGGGTGGSGCVCFGELVIAHRGQIKVEDTKVGDFLKGADPNTGAEIWNYIVRCDKDEASCVEITLANGYKHRVSKATPCATKISSEVRVVSAVAVSLVCKMYTKDNGWVPVVSNEDIGSQEVVHITLAPDSWMFVNDVLSHNTRKK